MRLMKHFVRNVGKYAKLYRDAQSGIAVIEDYAAGIGHSCHANIDCSGSVAGMKKQGYWETANKTARFGGFIYNIDSFVVASKYDEICAEECECASCIQRKGTKNENVVK